MPPTIDYHVEKQYFFCVLLLASLFTLFVTYGSLVPFEIRVHSADDAVDIFSKIPYLKLAAYSRADLIANALIYMPVSFFWCSIITARGTRPRYWIIWAAAIIVTLSALAFLIEFLQVFIAPRTISKNDLIAEFIGIIAGCALWYIIGFRFRNTAINLLSSGRIPLKNLLILYLGAYLLFSFFPFDFYLSMEEFLTGLESGKIYLLGNPDSQIGLLRTMLLRIAEVLSTIPISYLYFRTRTNFSVRISSFAAISLVLFAFVELIQLFMVSGTIAIVGLISRTAGIIIGYHLSGFRLSNHVKLSRDKVFLAGSLLLLPYILGILIVKGFSLPITFSLAEALAILNDTSFLPFYYHYFTTESLAFSSLMAQLALLFPVGVYMYILDSYRPKSSSTKTYILLLFGAFISFAVEAINLFFSLMRPDPTNILIGSVAVLLGYGVSKLIYQSLAEPLPNAISVVENPQSLTSGSSNNPHASTLPISHSIAMGSKVVPIIALLAACFYAFNYPLSKLLLLITSGLYLILLLRWNYAWLLIVPASIPLADLYVLSGRYFMTELDYLILLTIAFKYFSGHTLFPSLKHDRLFFAILFLLVIGYLCSIFQVIYPLPKIDSNSFVSIYSPFNSLRISKSLLWALLLYPVLNYESKHNRDWFSQMATGMTIGLLSVCVVVLVERALFPGVLNFLSSDYRVKGSFSSMHTGGGHIDSYLMMTLPFLAWFFMRRPTLPMAILYPVFFTLTIYTIFVTNSRGPYIITPILALLLVSGNYLANRIVRPGAKGKVIWILGLLVTAIWIFFPLLNSSTLSTRFEVVGEDKDVRLSHWKHASSLVGDYGGNIFFGNGPGSFPSKLYFDRISKGDHTAAHQLASENGNTFLRVTGGDNIYTSQYINLDAGQTYFLHFQARKHLPDTRISFPVCEMWIMDSFRCISNSVELPNEPNWSDHFLEIQTDNLKPLQGIAYYIMRRPVVFSLFTDGYADIDNIELLDGKGKNILANGGFENGKDHWYFSADNHLLWHTKNILVNLYHDFGIVGLTCILALALLCLSRCFNMILQGNKAAIALLVSMVGFAGIGTVCSIFDVPQLSFLFYFVLFASHILWTSSKERATLRSRQTLSQ